jgi:HSP90 family molecular chaperone
MTAEERTFQVHTEGLVQLLAQNLYADPDIFLREIIQNACDSIHRRSVLAAGHGETDLPSPQIRVVANREQKTIEISDNGCGLTRQEIDQYLSTIGRSGTDELRRRIQEADRSRAAELIGQFAMGMLSAFIVADRVSLVTRAADHQALRWQSRGGESYEVGPSERQQVGTTVTLHVRSEHIRYLETARLRAIIRTYADFLGMPVYLNDEADPANAVTAPWHRSYPSERERHRAYYEFWENKFLSETSLHVFAVDAGFDWDDVSQPDGEGHGRVQGVLAITDRHTPDVNVRGTVDIYIKRMFISAGNRDVLPPWAKFLQGALECDELTPNAARDNVIRNAALAAVQQTLSDLIVRELTELSQRDHQRFIDIMRWHSYHLLAMSVVEEYEEFFRAVADLMPLESDQGPITVAEYLRTAPPRSDGSRLIYYITERGSANQYFLLAGARSMRVFNCAEPFSERFLKRYAEIWPERAHLHRLDVAGSETIFEPLTEAEREAFADLQAAYSLIFPDLRCVAEVSRFRPVEVPAVLTETRDGRSRREMEQISTDLAMPGYVRDILKGFLSEEREPLTLHLNANNPTIQKLATRGNLRDNVSRQALVSLYNNALMLLARALRVEDVQAMFVQYNQVIELMLSLDAERGGFERDLYARQIEVDELHGPPGAATRLDPYVSCFVAMPFSDDRATSVYQAVRAVLEDQPYFWRVVRADNTVEQPELWSNLRTKLLRAHCYIAILTGNINPGMMLQLGQLEALQRPLLLLRDASVVEPPVELNSLLCEQISASGSDLVDEVREAIARQDRLQHLQGDKYLSEAALKRHGFLEGEVSREISRIFPTWDQFIQADDKSAARQLGIRRSIVQALQASLAEAE